MRDTETKSKRQIIYRNAEEEEEKKPERNWFIGGVEKKLSHHGINPVNDVIATLRTKYFTDSCHRHTAHRPQIVLSAHNFIKGRR